MQTDELLARINRLEKQNRWTRGIAVLAIVLLVIVSLAGTFFFMRAAAVQKEIRASSFCLVDESGNNRGRFAIMKDGAGLALYDESGKVRAGVFATKLGASLDLCDENGKIRGYFNVGKDGPRLDLRDEHGKRLFSAP
jgi:hypothetical protein